MSKLYAGIGSRNTPEEVLLEMQFVARTIGDMGWKLRSGGAKGADTAFQGGAKNMEIHLPWSGYNGLRPTHNGSIIVPTYNPNVRTIAEAHHGAWHLLNDAGRLFMDRNITLLLGQNLDDPVSMIICWTPLGRITGGTGQAMRAAKSYNIPIFNLALMEDKTALSDFVNNQE